MKIMLFSPVYPSNDSSGAIMLRDLCRLVKSDSIYCFVPRDPKLPKTLASKVPNIAAYKIVKRPIETPYRFPRWFFGKQLSWLIEKLKNLYIYTVITRQAIVFGGKHKVDCIWVILQGKTMINCALPVARALGVPVISQVWDDPEWILNSTGIPQEDKERALENFSQILKKSVVCATASEPMAEIFNKKYYAKTVAFLGSLDQKMALPPAQKIHQGSKLKIGFAGQIYTQIEWKAFFEALESVKWRILGREVEIYLLGKPGYYGVPETNLGKVIALGYKSQKSAIKVLSEMDFLYCPYWFDKKRQKISRTSFPSKLATYFASGRPVFFHGQEFSSAAKFIKENNCVLTCYSLEKKVILSKIKSLAKDQKEYSRLTRAGLVAFNKFLTYGNLALKLDSFLGQVRIKTEK